MLLGYCVFSTIFLATSVDSSAYIMSCASTRRLLPGTEPTLRSRAFWAFLQAGMALAIISIGGLQAVKIFANFAGALMLIPIAIAIIAWFKFIRHHDVNGEIKRLDTSIEEERGRNPSPFVVDPAD